MTCDDKMSLRCQPVIVRKRDINPSNFCWVDLKNLEGSRRVCMAFSKYERAAISETICPEMLIVGKYASWTLIFQNILTNPMISEISFL